MLFKKKKFVNISLLRVMIFFNKCWLRLLFIDINNNYLYYQ